MTRRKPQLPEPELDPVEELEVEEQVKEELDAIRTLRKFVGEFAETGWKVQLSRRNPATNRYAYLRTVPFELFGQDWVARTFGGGSFQAIALDGKGAYRKSVTFDVDETVTVEKPAPAVIGNSGGDRMWEMLLMVFQQNAEAQRLQSQQTTAILTAMIGNRGDPLELAAKIAELTRGAGGGGDMLGVMKEAIGLYREGVSEGRDGGEGGGGMGALIRDLVPPVLDVIGKTAHPAPAPAPLPQLPAPAPVAPLAPPPEATMLPGWYAYAQQFFPMMLDAARKGLSPELLTQMLAARLPEEVAEQLSADITASPDVDAWVVRTLGILPAPLARAFPEWTRSVLVALADQLTEDEPLGIPEDENPAGGGEA